MDAAFAASIRCILPCHKILSTCLLPWGCLSVFGSRTERVFAQLKALRECEQRAFFEAGDNDTAGCDWRFDGWQCWPPTPRGMTAKAPCPTLLPGNVNASATATYHCLMRGSWQDEMGNYDACTVSPYFDPELKLLLDIAEEIGEYVPWEQSSPRGENWMWQEKIDHFKHCLEHVLLKPFPELGANESLCPRTWDGWNCWDDTPPGQTVFAPCPQFVAGFLSSRQAHKLCTSNGTWFRHPVTGHVWSNYTACVDTHDLQFRNLVNSLYVTGYSISLVALLLSLFIFCYFRSLRCRRITIHKNLFTSFIINNLCWILWYIHVIAQPHVIEESPSWCQALHVVTQYFLLCNYLWMFCEGLYLHTLLVMAFIAEDKILKWFLLIGWGFPLLPTIGYAVMRGLDPEASRMCWVEHDVWYTYILSVPVCFSILLSFAFLVNIVRVLVTKLRAVNSPDNESTRKAVRATVILLPLLGLHYVVTPFRPDKGSIFLAYEIISALVTSLQGLCVALLFCFFNGEVLGVLRKTLSQTPCFRNDGRRMSYANTSISFLPRRSSDGRSPSVSPNHQQTML
ncbi:calcitonin gene-related peptide type 1 receptor-like isoform X1 [Rhipicephalus microplus]|uniref:calcitonin gene-related peptide type 1 receptor-like isoform X1 n=1 Tax=Rhipicephalus microplus TaxID=6941 RepID=UPI003F6B5085